MFDLSPHVPDGVLQAYSLDEREYLGVPHLDSHENEMLRNGQAIDPPLDFIHEPPKIIHGDAATANQIRDNFRRFMRREHLTFSFVIELDTGVETASLADFQLVHFTPRDGQP